MNAPVPARQPRYNGGMLPRVVAVVCGLAAAGLRVGLRHARKASAPVPLPDAGPARRARRASIAEYLPDPPLPAEPVSAEAVAAAAAARPPAAARRAARPTRPSEEPAGPARRRPRRPPRRRSPCRAPAPTPRPTSRCAPCSAQAARDLGRVNYQALDADGRAQYDTARRFMQQADEALKGRNVMFAGKLADKAATMAAVLVR